MIGSTRLVPAEQIRQRRVDVVLFDGFQLLDVFGPVELLSRFPDAISLRFLGPSAGAVSSSQGVEVFATQSYADAGQPDIVMVPGGMGTRGLVNDATFLDWLRDWAGDAAIVSSVCTGSAVLAAAGLLEGYRATSNKRSFAWAASHGREVEWVRQARWVEDRSRWTSSGIAAGMDMAAALLVTIVGADAAQEAADVAELEIHSDPTWDPFARRWGAVD
jgi:transcriptional regulator GlxA family with amidase domain